MDRNARAALLASIVLAVPGMVAAKARPPSVFVDKGACPFECCTYRQWTAVRPVQTFQKPSLRAARLGTIPANTQVLAMTGEVRTVGKKFIVHRVHDRYKPGDTLMVYTYHGEGVFTVWFDGEFHTEDLGFSPYGGTSGSRCTDRKHCWGELASELKSDWWAQVKLPDGKIAWVHDMENFEGIDACG